ncbi:MULTISPECIES: dipicolinate synthase subunit DpsA [Mycobacteriaceae]|uniref:Dipicolinate synthase subunit DpsA n=1 Tax=Mycolicibacterium parafortuitum TaxID=39692 RepID=A0ACC6MA89_MYCPF|nr:MULTISPECIES: dipicolinate synthase subunit DpsA [Mycobacteriaceae]MDZ5083858.1 dipicolinate synthase subunit DpsA [Mycolicibacterium parafortuitum]GFM16665.1 shikimate/quinate 5-dehydrogenase [Mycobacterium sp. PO1]GFM21652.1 Shikimate/quinate 5-dehydrogenase [Mycobacterium sp. PO2]
MNWSDLTIAVVGGDEREQEIARLAAQTGASVRAYGFVGADTPIDGVHSVAGLEEAVDGADVLLLPIPGIAADGSLFAPGHAPPIVITAALLKLMVSPAHIILGKADPALAAAAAQVGARLDEYEHDQELMLLRAPAIVEGVLRVAIENTRFTLNDAAAVVVGYGNIGARLATTLRALGASVTVAARNPVQRAAAYAAHLQSVPLAELPSAVTGASMLFSAVPAPIVDSSVLTGLRPGSLVVDISAPPGSVDLSAATELGHRAVWARGMGRRAPVTVGSSQWQGVRNRIEQRRRAVSM